MLKKIHFMAVVPSGHDKGFKRQAYFLIDEKSPKNAVLIHYLGDEGIAVNFPHRNSNSENSHVFLRTCPSVLSNLASIKDLPSNVYKDAISKPASDCPPAQQHIYMPRNFRQIKNLQYKERQKSRLTHDALYNLHELAYDLDGFVRVITTYPDLIVICGIDQLVIINELDLILQMESESPQLLSYDTTFSAW